MACAACPEQAPKGEGIAGPHHVQLYPSLSPDKSEGIDGGRQPNIAYQGRQPSVHPMTTLETKQYDPLVRVLSEADCASVESLIMLSFPCYYSRASFILR